MESVDNKRLEMLSMDGLEIRAFRELHALSHGCQIEEVTRWFNSPIYDPTTGDPRPLSLPVAHCITHKVISAPII